MKLIGAFFCVAACLLFGLAFLENEKRKMQAYNGLSNALMLIKTELCASLPPLAELMKQAAESSVGCVKAFFQIVLDEFYKIGETEFAEIWNEAAEESFDLFTQEQLKMLFLPGMLLGKSAGETQAEALEAAALYFRAELNKKEEKMSGSRKLAIGLPVCAGLLIVILLC